MFWLIKKELELPNGWIKYDFDNQRIELPLSVAEEIADMIEVPVQMIEIHPTYERLEVGLVHLNEYR